MRTYTLMVAPPRGVVRDVAWAEIVTTTDTTGSGQAMPVAVKAEYDGSMVAAGPTESATASRVFRPIAGVDHDGLQGRVEPAGLDQLLQAGHRGPAGGLGEDPLGAGQQQDALAHLVVADVLDRTTGAAADVEHVGAVGRVADGQALGDGVGLDRADRRRCRPCTPWLTGEQPVAWAPKIRVGLVLDEPERDELLEAPCRPWSAASPRRPGSRPGRGSASRAARRSRSRASWSPRRRRGGR